MGRGRTTSRASPVDIPHGNALTVVSGVCGLRQALARLRHRSTPKAQRRYVESLSSYARQFLERIEKPDVDHYRRPGLPPSPSSRRTHTRNPRSTVATATEIYDYLRLLYARCGTSHCLHCGGLRKRDSVDEIASPPSRSGPKALAPRRSSPSTLQKKLGPIPLPRSEESPPSAQAPKTRRQEKSSRSDSQRLPRRNLTEDAKGASRRATPPRVQPPHQAGNKGRRSSSSPPPNRLLELDFTLPVFVLLDRLSVSPRDSRARIVDAVETGYRAELRRSSV